LIEVLFIYVKISYDTPVKILYYSSQKLENYNIYYYCDIENDLISPSSPIKNMYMEMIRYVYVIYMFLSIPYHNSIYFIKIYFLQNFLKK